MLTKQKTLLGRVPRWRAAGELLCHIACGLRFYGNGVSFWVVSGQSPCAACTSGSGSFLVACAPLSQDGVQHQRSWEVGCLLPLIGPSQILPVSLQGSTLFLIRASYCETTQASSYYHAGPRLSVSVSGPSNTMDNSKINDEELQSSEPFHCTIAKSGLKIKSSLQ